MENKYLAFLTIPSVQKLITASRKTIDLWSGSFLVNALMKDLLNFIKNTYKVENIILPHEDLLNSKSDTADIPNVSFLILSLEENNLEDFIKSVENKFVNLLKGKLLNFKELIKDEDILNLAEKQIENSLNIFIALKKLSGDYKENRDSLIKYMATLKGFKAKESNYIEGFKIFNLTSHTNVFSFPNYKEFLSSIDILNPEIVKGAYRCYICGDRVILGANETDFTGKDFWENLEKNNKIPLEKEKLCGFCLGKRIFREKEFPQKEKVPSVSDISMKMVKEHIKKIDEGREIWEIFEKERDNFNPHIKTAIENKNLDILDGEWLMPAIWENKRDYDIAFNQNISDEEKKDIALRIRKSLNKFYNNKDLKPIYHYAILMMDGDNMGKKISLLNTPEKQRELSKILSKFSREVKNIVKNHNGYLIYSGGDDVLALLPVEKSIDCAYEIQKNFKNTTKDFYKKYIESENKEDDYKFTMSAGLVFAHHKLPLRYVLEQVRNCESKAKKSGKNRICVKYIKHSYAFAETIKDWEKVLKLQDLSKKDFPKTLAYQFSDLVKDLENSEIIENIAGYLFKKKKINEEVKDLILETVELKEKDDLPSVLKIANFIAQNSLEVKNVKA